MDYLSRESAPFDGDFWNSIDEAVTNAAKKILVGRKFLTLYGPLGAGAQGINIDSESKTEKIENGVVQTMGRTYTEIPQIYDDFYLLWRDIEMSKSSGYPVDLSAAVASAENLARMEDKFIFFGNKSLGVAGLTNAPGVNKIKKGDWSTGEASYQDIVKGITLLNEKGFVGRYALVVTPDFYIDLQRIQPGTGVMEIDRVRNLLSDRIYYSTSLGLKKAVLVCCEPQHMDLVIGQDIITSYLELVDLNHHMRVLETVLPRIKKPEAVVVYE